MLIKRIVAFLQSHWHHPLAAFCLLWMGQSISLIGSELNSFALGVWVYQNHQVVTEFALISFFTLLPKILLSPLAGVYADRYNRRWLMIISDTGAALATGGIALLFLLGNLQVWHIYLAVAISSAFSAFQWPAYAAATTILVPTQSLGLANGLVQLSQAFGQLLAPSLAGFLLGVIQLSGIIFIDLLTFSLSLLSLIFVKIPSLNFRDGQEPSPDNFWQEIWAGWCYIISHRGLLSLLIFFTSDNFFTGFVVILVTPLILSFTSPAILGLIMSIGGVGMILGSLLMTCWGRINSYIKGIFIFNYLSGLAIFCAGLYPSTILLGLCSFLFFFSLPIINGCSQVIWQKTVAPEIQGRVFALERMLAWICLPIAYILSGILADQVFEPLMQPQGFLANNLGLIVGTGPGRGIGVMFMLIGLINLLTTTIAFSRPSIRYIEQA